MSDSTLDPPAQLQDSPHLRGDVVCFAGHLASMTHAEAHTLVHAHGGEASATLIRSVTLLVVGEGALLLEEDGSPSLKLTRAREWEAEGTGLRVITESDWLYLLNLVERQRDVHKLYPAPMLARMLDVPPRLIRRWERAGLIKPSQRVHRLSWFDFNEVASARRLAELLAAGMPHSELERSLQRLKELLPDVDQPLAQLEILSQNRRLFYRDRFGPVEARTGQRHLDFDPPQQSEDDHPSTLKVNAGQDSPSLPDLNSVDWFDEGLELLALDEAAPAAEAFRTHLMQHAGDPEANFYLAEALYRLDEPAAAAERYLVAIESDSHYLEAWVQLGCLHIEQRQFESARDSLRMAIEIHPGYADAHWHLAEVSYQLDDASAAREHWETYLRHDDRGLWAETARQRLSQLPVES